MITKIKFPNTSTPSSVSGMKKNGKDVLYLKRNGVTYYTKHFKVTTNLTGVSLATYNTPEYKQPLSLSFVPDIGLQLLPSTVNVTMDGVDITDTAFRILTNTIEIQSVTGNVVITATAAVVDMNYQPLLCIFTKEKGSGSNVPSNGIILPYKPSSNTKLELDVFLASNTYSMLYNAAERNPNTTPSDSYPQFFFWTRYTTANSYRVSWGNRTNGNNSINNRIIQTQKRIKVICDRGTFTYENYLGSIQSFESDNTLTSWNVNNNLCIFADNRGGSGKTASYNCFGGLYRCTAMDYNSTTRNYDLALDCIPVKRLSDGKLGIYDLVSGTAIVNDENTMPSDRYMEPNILTTSSLTNCTRTLLSAAETGTITRAVIGSTWRVKLTPSSDYTFAGGVSPQVKIANIDVTSQVVTDNGDGTYTITIVNVPQEPIEITAEAVALPYDAEVEYLESDGVAYIDTGIVPNNTLSFKVSFYNNGPLDSGGYGNVFGARKNYAGNMYQATLFNGGEVRFGTSKNMVPMTTGTINNVEFDGGTTIVCNGNTYTAQKGSISLPSNGTIILFGIRDNGDPSQLQAGRIYYCSFGSVRDFIPVRKDGVGYLYDKVSGQLFGNAASSGAFTYGNDI